MIKLFLISSLISFSVVVLAQIETWHECKSCVQTQIWYKELASGKDFAVKSEAIVVADYHKLIETIKDIESFAEWVSNCKSVNVIKSNENGGIYRTIISRPWPLKDGEAYIQYYFVEDAVKQEFKMVLSCVTDSFKFDEKYQKITRFKAVWTVSKKDEKTLVLKYLAETGGPENMPGLVKRMFLCDAPCNTLNMLIYVVNHKNL